MLRTSLTLMLLLSTSLCVGQTLTLETIMADPDWIGSPPERPYWADDGASVYYEQRLKGQNHHELRRLRLDGGEPETVGAGDYARDSNRTAVYSSSGAQVAWVSDGDVLVKDLRRGTVKRLTSTDDIAQSPVFVESDSALAYQRDGEYVVHDLATGRIVKLTDIRFSDDPDAPEYDELSEHQLSTYSTVADDKRRRRDAELAERERRRLAGAPLPLYLGKDHKAANRWLSPDGQHLLVTTTASKAENGRVGKMPNYVTASGYVELSDLRTRVGRNDPAGERLWLVDARNRHATEISFEGLPGIDKDPLAKLRKSALQHHLANGAAEEALAKKLAATLPRPLRVEAVRFSRDGAKAALRLHSVDNKDRWIVVVTLANGELSVEHRLTDAAWINYAHNDFGWFADGQSIWYLSEENGFSHLYRKKLSARRHQALTAGRFVVSDPVLSPDDQQFLVRANVAHPADYDVYRVSVDGGELTNLTRFSGVDEFTVSPDWKSVLVLRGRIDQHPELYLSPIDIEAEQPPRQLTTTVSEDYLSKGFRVPEIIAIDGSHVEPPIYSKLYLPADFDSSKTYPAVMFVHGAGYTQNAHRGWSYYFREYMFHNLLNQHGYIVLDMDYRASKGYGRDWRTAIYRQMGHPELEDMLDGVEFLVSNFSVDRDRIGIYGGSYGGFMTFMALFRAPKVFAAGAALRPVSDWRHYNHGYTANILNTPLIDPEAYRKSSPITYAEGLQKPLLIAAGMQDDNVFFQDAVLMVQRLIELEKPDFETAIYPLDPHGFVHASAWLDEYRRIFRLMENHLKP